MYEPYLLLPTTGTIQPSQIVGRTKEIASLLELLESQSVLIEQFRRMGKTLLLQKLEYLSHSNNLKNKAIYCIVQGVDGPTEITDALLSTLREERNLSLLQTSFEKIKAVYNSLRPEEVNIKDVSFKLPEFKTKWKEALTACLEDIANRKSEKGELITLIIDEFPMMLWNWVENQKANDAIELLDTMRRIRHSFKEKNNIRFLICGSIGMNVVLNRLRKEHKYNGEPFNDMTNFPIEAMNKEDALFLCQCLYLGGYKCNGVNTDEVFNKICDDLENLPFYINKLFSIISSEFNRELTIQNVNSAFNSLMEQQIHSDAFNQLHARIKIYYAKDDAECMFKLLNILCDYDVPTLESIIIEKSSIEEALIKDSLTTLTKEHYLTRTFVSNKRHYQFKYKLFKEWWKLNKA